MKFVAVVLALLASIALTRADSTVVFNEIMYHPQTNEAQLEWVELHNQMSVDMEISGWYLTNGIYYKFAEGTVVPGGGYLIVASSPADLVAATGATNVYGPFVGRLANGGDTLELRNNNNRLMDSVTYGAEGDWPVAPDGAGVSLAKWNENLGSDLPQNWTSSIRVGGTPGAANFPSPHLVTSSSVLVPIEQTWKYDQSGTNDWSSGTAWLQPDFPETGWGSGQGLLAYETCGCLPEPIRTTLRTNNSVITFYFRSAFNYTNDPTQTSLSLRHVIDDGMILYLNGAEVWRIGMPTGAVTYATLAGRGVGDAVYEGPFNIPSDSLIRGTNILAAEVHQTASTSSDITFGLNLSELMTTTVGGQVQTGGVATVAFNELASSTNSAFWLELANYGTTNVPLGGYVIARLGGAYREYVLPDQTLAPGGFLQVTKAMMGFGVDSGDKLILYAPGRGNVVDAVVAKKTPRGRSPDGTGRWLYPDQPTPGASNHFSFHNEIVINEIMYDHRAIPATPALYGTNLLVNITNVWRYNQQGVDLGSNWRTPDYNDTTWLSGRALLYNIISTLPAPKNTQLALTNSSGTRLITWYFRSSFVFTGSLDGLQLNLHPIVDDGAVFYLNGVEIYRLNMADGPVAYTNFASASVATPTYTGPFLVPTNSLMQGTNVLAVEVHQVSTNGLIQSLDVVFGTELNSTALLSPSLPFHDSPESWLELYNRGTNVIDLTGWELDGGIGYSFATNKTIGPGGYLVVAKDVPFLQSLYPAIDIVGPFDHKLSHQSDQIILRDPSGNPANEVRYYSSGRWPEYAHAGGSSLELRDPRADNSKPEAWAASDEASKSQWNTYSYRGTAAAETAASPTQWKEFVLGLLSAGEVLLDDISVVDVASSAQLIQNGSFETGLNAWRVIGNHHGVVELDPENASNHVLHLTASGPTEHMHNHVETTLANGASITNGRDYQISFRAKWLAGSSDLNTRLYFNRLPKITSLAVPPLNGTPGAPNSRYSANVGPTYSDFAHAPVVPNANQPVTVSVAAKDPDGVSGVTLWWAVDGSVWNQVAMTPTNGLFKGTIPGNPASTLIQFYVEGTDGLGATSTFPARGRNSRALLKVNDGAAIFDRLHNIRMLMTAAEANFMHAPTNVMSNDILGTTVVYDEQQVFYDVGLHLQASERGRNDSSRVGFTLEFHPDELFRGVHGAVTMDRSGGYTGPSKRHDEIVIKHMINHAGGMPGMYDDLVHVLTPRSQENSTALLIMAKYGDVFLESQFKNGADGNLFKLELIYYPLSTVDGTAQGAKLPQPDNVLETDFQDLGNNKESYRWNFLNENNHVRDDYSQIMNVSKTFSFSGAALDAMSQQFLDVNEWMRVFAFESLPGIIDSYGFGLAHNIMVYIRPEDLKGMAFSWDMDFDFYNNDTTRPILAGGNLGKIIALPANQRLYYGHLFDMITTTCNSAYISRWTTHYGSLVGQDWSGIATFIQNRANFVMGQLPTQIPFSITSNNGNNFSTNNNLVVLSGVAPIQVKTIEVNGISYAVTWTSLSNWVVRVPIGSGANTLTVRGLDTHGNAVSGAIDTITVTDTTPVPQPKDFVVINEIMYHATVDGAGFVEIHNIHPTVTFDLSNWRLDGADFTFPQGSIILPGGFLLVVHDVNIFAQTYGNTIPVAGQYNGTLQNGGESLKLVRPISTNLDEIIDEVRYDDQPPWPTAADGLGPSLQLIDPTQENYRACNWVADGFTPGATNSVRAALPLFPPVWINEVLPINTNSIADNFGERAPWIELFNNGANAVSLKGFFLTDNLTNLTQWPFPASASINPGQFLIVWADGDIGQTTATDWHTNFRLTNSSGSIALVRTNTGRVEVLDYFNYFGLSANHSFGSVPDGQPQSRQFFFYVTPGASNNPAAPPVPVVINEWMADNSAPYGFTDPADGLYQDWFELYNPNTNAVDLSGYYLTDDLMDPTKWRIPPNTFIAGRGFLIVWADKDTTQNGGTNGDLHADFQLSNGGEQIGLFAPDGTAQSTVIFGQQIQNVSQGLFPDGNTNGVYFMTNFTPRAANSLQLPASPQIENLSVTPGGLVSMTFNIGLYKHYQIEFKDDLAVNGWTPLGGIQTALTSPVTAYDNIGMHSQRFYHVVLLY